MDFMGSNYQIKIILRALIFAVVLSMLIAFIFSNPKEYIYGLLFSTSITVLNFRLMSISIQRALNMPQKKIKFFIATNYAIRTAIYGIILSVSYMADYLNFYTAIIGIFSVKIVILMGVLDHKYLLKFKKKV